MKVKLILWYDDGETGAAVVPHDIPDDEAIIRGITCDLPRHRLVKDFKGQTFEGDLLVHEDISEEDLAKQEALNMGDVFDVSGVYDVEVRTLEVLQ
jgi:hypothetical protein